MKQFNDKVSILILDYNKPEEARLCLESVQKHCKFEKEVVFYSNGGFQDYVIDFYQDGLIDKLVLSKKNMGLGIGTTDLLQLCRTEYFIYLQQDQYFYRDLTEHDLGILKGFLEYPEYGCISLAGSPCGLDIYSDRCHLGKTDFFRSMDEWEDGFPDKGVGPFWDGAEGYNENFIQRYFKEHKFLAPAINPPFVMDNGQWSIRENPDGSIFKHRPSTKQLWVLKKPEERQAWPEGLTDFEWTLILEDKWEQGSIPENWKKDSFKVEGWD